MPAAAGMSVVATVRSNHVSLLETVLARARLLKSSLDEVGPFEFEVLHAIRHLRNDAYGAKICIHLSDILHRDVAIGQVYTALSRLQEKSLVSSTFTKPEPRRGGRSRKVFMLTKPGSRILDTAAVVAVAADAPMAVQGEELSWNTLYPAHTHSQGDNRDSENHAESRSRLGRSDSELGRSDTGHLSSRAS